MAEPRKFSILAVLPIVIFALLLSAIFLPKLMSNLGGNNPSDLPSTRIGSPAPALFVSEGQDPATAFSDETLRTPGVKLVNFWASWCPPCRAEHPLLIKLAEEGLPIYGVNYKDRPKDAARFLAELGDPFTAILSDPRGRNGIEWGVLAMPESYLIDSDGVIVLHFRGPITRRVVESMIRPAIEAVK
ncbi:MAG: DsbE family thiol:disulfide interchange protein [Marinosulfonomonas sp.]|nr:DsbE family thiol:disulfide interchange protein [Marinosulfonomonas sp.]